MVDDPLRVALANFTHNMRVSHDRRIAFREERGIVPSDWTEGMDAGEESMLAGLEYLVGLYPPTPLRVAHHVRYIDHVSMGREAPNPRS